MLSVFFELWSAFTEYVVSRIDEAVKEYSAQFDKLMFMLKEQVYIHVIYSVFYM